MNQSVHTFFLSSLIRNWLTIKLSIKYKLQIRVTQIYL